MAITMIPTAAPEISPAGIPNKLFIYPPVKGLFKNHEQTNDDCSYGEDNQSPSEGNQKYHLTDQQYSNHEQRKKERDEHCGQQFHVSSSLLMYAL
jgi:hypothetical protein